MLILLIFSYVSELPIHIKGSVGTYLSAGYIQRLCNVHK